MKITNCHFRRQQRGCGGGRDKGNSIREKFIGDFNKTLMFYFISRVVIAELFIFLFLINSRISKISY